MAGEARREEIRRIHRTHRLFYELLGGAILLLIGVAIGAHFFERDNGNDYHMNLATEALGIVATIFIINRWYAHRDMQRATSEKKDNLIQQASSQYNDVALRSIEQIRTHGWLNPDDGILAGKNLSGANLADADLEAANLRGSNFHKAILSGANLFVADLRGAILYRANLIGANLLNAYLQDADLEAAELKDAYMWKAQLQGAILSGGQLQMADLREAELEFANLEGSILHETSLSKANLQNANLAYADLRGANLSGANIEQASLDSATLPDGTKFTDAMDLKRFTDPFHPEFTSTRNRIFALRDEMDFEILERYES